MGAQYSHLIFQIPEHPSYDENLDGLSWIDPGGGASKIPAIFIEWKGRNNERYFITLIH
jgi:hypothetical protein